MKIKQIIICFLLISLSQFTTGSETDNILSTQSISYHFKSNLEQNLIEIEIYEKNDLQNGFFKKRFKIPFENCIQNPKLPNNIRYYIEPQLQTGYGYYFVNVVKINNQYKVIVSVFVRYAKNIINLFKSSNNILLKQKQLVFDYSDYYVSDNMNYYTTQILQSKNEAYITYSRFDYSNTFSPSFKNTTFINNTNLLYNHNYKKILPNNSFTIKIQEKNINIYNNINSIKKIVKNNNHLFIIKHSTQKTKNELIICNKSFNIVNIKKTPYNISNIKFLRKNKDYLLLEGYIILNQENKKTKHKVNYIYNINSNTLKTILIKKENKIFSNIEIIKINSSINFLFYDHETNTLYHFNKGITTIEQYLNYNEIDKYLLKEFE